MFESNNEERKKNIVKEDKNTFVFLLFLFFK